MGTWSGDYRDGIAPDARAEIKRISVELAELRIRYVACTDDAERDRLAEREDSLEHRMYELITGQRLENGKRPADPIFNLMIGVGTMSP